MHKSFECALGGCSLCIPRVQDVAASDVAEAQAAVVAAAERVSDASPYLPEEDAAVDALRDAVRAMREARKGAADADND